ncbi:hypothetical protein BDBG_01990 [Blastomyces gilchristii SLH14081]|uniref:BTB domain transcription factor n=1 Tax=Blastomyces gilchristii (strain SLH14081) TaxID=559298 RepID=A0A179UED7_BLAGS|nr:uncharacterized protein BDBG_01990 [Blastomyces gilchristii SLH14081]OAT05628.1 hypothetical protein BDBG_01990 [Blastomyces gilchristii SLH14081]
MPSRTSTRQAAVKANEALHQGARAGTKKTAGGKRKGREQEEIPKTKREKKEEEPTELGEGKLEKGMEEPPTEERKEEAEATNGGLNEPKEPEKMYTERPEQKEAPKETEPKAEAKELEREAKQPEPDQAKESEQKEEVKKPAEAEQHKGDAGKQQPHKEHVAIPGGKEKAPEPTAVKTGEEGKTLPSNVLEKGIIYFFFRGKVGVEEPEGVGDVARSFIVLRPLPSDAKLGQGTTGDNQNCRLLVLPKKVLPKSTRDRFMGFVEKAHTTVKTIRDSFLAIEKETATRGTTYTPAATPIAEGAYVITSKDRTSHLAYRLTVPSELGEVQKDIGLQERGSFIASAKNPEYGGPEAARLPQGPDYPQNVQEEFDDLRWVPLRPEFLDFPNAQFLLIGGQHQDPAEADKVAGKLEHQDESRTSPLKDDDVVYEDLGMDSRNYPDVTTTWG